MNISKRGLIPGLNSRPATLPPPMTTGRPQRLRQCKRVPDHLTAAQFAQRMGALGPLLLEEGLTAQLRAAAAVFSEISPLDLIEELAGGGGRRAWLTEQWYGWCHLGFLVPAGLYHRLPSVATSLGFDAAQSHFRSEVMTLELSALSGAPVETSVFEGYRLSARAAHGLEAFAPAVEPEVGREWIAKGVGIHLGLGLREARAVEVVQRWFEEAGFQPAEFLNGGPAVNRAEDIQVLYLDGQVERHKLRLEFYHSASQLKFADRWAASAAGEA